MDLQAIEARLAAATPGPWKTQDFVDAPPEDAGSAVVKQGNGGLVAYALRSGAVEHEWYDKPQCDADAEFIAHAPEDIRALIDEVKAVRDAVARHLEVGYDEGPVILSAGATAADPLPGLEGTDLNRKVRDEIYRQLSGHYGDFNVPTQKEAQAVIDAVAGHLLNAVPDDSADDVRKALGL